MTLGDPETLTGGYLYHLRMAALAPARDAQVRFFSFPDHPFPIPVAAGPRMIEAARGCDVVVVDSIAAWCAAPWLGRLHSPVAGMLHQLPGGMDHNGLRHTLQAPLDRRAYRHMSTIMVASDALKADLSAELDPSRLVVVAPGRDVAAPSRVISDLSNGRRIALLAVGNWVERKGIVELLDAFAELRPDLATLHLVGRTDIDPRYGARVEQAVARLGDRVVVHGPLPKEEVAAMYLAADAFVLASREEPYGTVYGEAMASGLPVIGWDSGNLPHLARHDASGLIVPRGDVKALTRSLGRIATDEDLRARLARGAKERSASFPTWEETANRFFGELRRLVTL